MTNRDINHILAGFDKEKATAFDKDYADRKYEEYKNNYIDDSESRSYLRDKLLNKEIFILAPGASINDKAHEIGEYICEHKPVVISINFIPEGYPLDYAFFSNAKRLGQAADSSVRMILTSNIETEKEAIRLNYNTLSSAFDQGYNSFIMLLKLLVELGIQNVTVAGTDGYKNDGKNYYKTSLKSRTQCDGNYNVAVSRAIKQIGINVNYFTESAYE